MAEPPKRVRSMVRTSDDANPPPIFHGVNGGKARGKSGGRSAEEEVDIEEALNLTGHGMYHHALLLTGVLSALSHQGQTAMLSYLLPAAECDLGLTDLHKGLLAATPYAGMLFTSLMWGFLSDTFGRRRLLILTYFLDGVANVLSSFSQAYWFLILMRFSGGLIISGPMSIQKTFLSEFHGAATRPRVIMWTGVFVAIANVFFPALAWAVLPLPFAWTPVAGFTFNSWRLFVAISSMSGFGAAFCISLFAESPKYLLSSGHPEEALQVLRKMYSWNKNADANTYPVRRLRAETGSPAQSPGGNYKKSPLQVLRLGWRQVRPLFLQPLRNRALLVFAIQFCTLLGMNTVRLWVPQLFSSIEEYNLHHPAASNVALCEMLAAVKRPEVRAAAQAGEAGEPVPCTVALLEDTVYVRAGIVGAATAIAFFTATFTIRLTGKRYMMMGTFLVGGAAGIALYWARSDDVTLALSSMYVALVGVSHTVAIAFVVDLFPTTLRNMAVSLTLMAGQLGTVLGNVAFPLLLELNCVVVFFLLGAIPISCAGLCILLPRSSNADQTLLK